MVALSVNINHTVSLTQSKFLKICQNYNLPAKLEQQQ